METCCILKAQSHQNGLPCVLQAIGIILKNTYIHFSFLAALDLSGGMWDLHCVMLDLSLWPTNSLVVVGGLSCSAVCGILFPGSVIETGFPELQGGFLTTGPQGKSL